MPELVLLPSTTYQPPSPPQARRAGRSLNTIMEEEPEESYVRQKMHGQRRIQARPSNEKIVQWLSPRSDHFPTPRGFHFMSAPILPDSPSTASFDESNSPSTSSNPWNRASVSTDVTEFDDIYDISDDEDARQKMTRVSSLKRQGSSRSTMSRQSNNAVAAPSHRTLPPLVIPGQRESNMERWSGRPDFKKLMSPVPPTPPAKVEMSPAVMSFYHSQQNLEVPTISAPPSLDGSLSSDQMATMSAPATPVIGAEDNVTPEDWSGVQLQPGALATLHALSGNDSTDGDYAHEQVIEIPEERIPEMTQQESRLFNPLPRPVLRLATEHQQHQSLNGLTRLDIPSPSGFFSGLSPRTRHTWHLPSMTPDDIAPTSTIAEQFYRCPWEATPAVPSIPSFPLPPSQSTSLAALVSTATPVERVVEIRETVSDGMPTARPMILEQVVEADTVESAEPQTAFRIESPPSSPHEALVATEIVTVYDPEYTKKQQKENLTNMDRTERWLLAQKAYLQGVYPEEEPQSASSIGKETIQIQLDEPLEEEKEESPVAVKKSVRFSEVVVRNIPRSLPSMLARQESAYYRAFQDYIIRSRPADVFVHRLPRFETLQAQRVSLRETHRNQLLGKFQLSVVPQSARKRMSANVVRGDDVLVDDPEKLKREREEEAFSQMAMANWHVSALKALNGGRLCSKPIAKRLARISRIGHGPNRTRILDLGGQTTCDWGWHCAFTYPNTKVYTVTTKAIRQLSNCNIRGPPNHRQIAVEQLTKLPFPDDHFDLVSARELHSVLKFIGENGADEWETCLAEVMRVLKPGGYLDFDVLDSDIMNAGPMGLAKSVEFGFSLKTLGYDPNPTRMFLSRLGRAGFSDVKRAWQFLPMGHTKRAANDKPLPVLRDSSGVERSLELEAMVMGSTESIAAITGLVGGWTWERWLLRCEMEKVAGEGRIWLGAAEVREAGKCLDGVHDVVEEGRACGAGYRALTGFAMKPRA